MLPIIVMMVVTLLIRGQLEGVRKMMCRKYNSLPKTTRPAAASHCIERKCQTPKPVSGGALQATSVCSPGKGS